MFCSHFIVTGISAVAPAFISKKPIANQSQSSSRHRHKRFRCLDNSESDEDEGDDWVPSNKQHPKRLRHKLKVDLITEKNIF